MKSLGLLPFLLAATLAAQTEPTWTAKHVIFKQPGSFSQQELEAVAGLHPGMSVNGKALTDAANRLMATGYFDDIGANLDGTASNTTAIFNLKVTDPLQMLPVGFENLIWLTPAEITSAIQAKVPLFNGRLTEGSAQAETIDAALAEALAAKGITAKLEDEVVEPTLRYPARVYEFRVTSPQVVTNIKLGGVSPDLAPLVQKSINATARTAYSVGPAGMTTSGRILAPLLDAGYINATLDGVTLDPGTSDGRAVPIVVSAKLDAGDSYHVSALHFAGTPLLSAEAFAATQKLHAGDVASRKALLETLQPLDAAYRRKGYMDVLVKTAPALDAATHQVDYTVTVEPGEPYHMHEIIPDGLDPAAREAFDRTFLMKTGEAYNPEYVATFVRNNTSVKELSTYAANFKSVAFPATHTVDLYIFFAHAVTR
jgi:outer membrane protein insertion porin family